MLACWKFAQYDITWTLRGGVGGGHIIFRLDGMHVVNFEVIHLLVTFKERIQRHR